MNFQPSCYRVLSSSKPASPVTNGLKANFKVENLCRSCRRNRRGAAVVEFAIVAPVFILLVLGMVEMGRGVMVQQVITNASREGARAAVVDGSTVSSVQTVVKNYLTGAGLPASAATITVTIPAARYGNAATVAVSIPYSSVSWVPIAKFLSGKTLTASSSMRCESVQ